MTKSTLNVALWQGESNPGNVQKNVDDVARIASLAVAQSAEILVFPECFLTGYYTSADVADIAASVDDAVMERLQSIARDTGLTIVIGSYEQTETAIHNAAFVFHPQIGMIGPYRKRMLYGDWEKSTFQAGIEPLIFSLNGFKVGVLICFDVEFPERCRELAHLGADLIVVPTALMSPFENVARVMVPSRAMENGACVAYANRIGTEVDLHYTGRSCIAGADGSDLARACADQSELLVARISKKQLDQARHSVDYLSELSANP